MFSALPVPYVEWNEKNTRWLLAAFPLVGIAAGLVCWGWERLCGVLELPALLRGAGLCLAPVLITGGIHLDGYADTHDAFASHASPEKKREILKDPHLGAFAAIRLCVYFTASLALWTALPEYDGILFLMVFCLSRAMSGLAIAFFPLARNTGLASSFAAAADKKRLKILLAVFAALLSIGMCFRGFDGLAAVLAAWAVFLKYRHMAKAQFGGLSGDLAGWFLQTAELWMAVAVCLTQYLEAGL